jgi:hypothetical protein
MMMPGRLLALAATLIVSVGVEAAAQTVIVRKAPPGSPVEVVLNDAQIATGTADSAGDVRIPANAFLKSGTREMDAYLYVDICKDVRRVLIVERTTTPPPQEPGCDRRQISGLFLIRPVTTLVVDVGSPNPTVLLRQGPVSLEARQPWTGPPTGLVLSGGGALVSFSDFVGLACGGVPDCGGDGSKFAFTGAATYWFTPFLAAHASYIRPAKLTAEGDAGFFRFNSFLNPHIFTFGGKVGVPARRMRIYGQVGASYHRALSGTTQITDDITITAEDGTETTIEGGTSTFELETAGWGWQFSGGAEGWLSRSFALYGEAGWATIKGKAVDDADGEIDDRMTFLLFGIRVRLGR